jgi:hypothetical protein
MFMYRAVPISDLALLGSTREWATIRALKTWASDQGLIVQRIKSESDGSVSYYLSDDHGPIARIEQQS